MRVCLLLAAYASSARTPFGYEAHGADWAEGTCGSRTAQSPVNLADIYGPSTGTFEVNYGDPLSTFDIVNDGETLTTRVPSGRGVVVRGAAYDLDEISFHSPAEHTLGAHRPALEVQLKHSKPGSPRAVHLSVFFDPPSLGLLQGRGLLRAIKQEPEPWVPDPFSEPEPEISERQEADLESAAEVREVDALTAASALVGLKEPPTNTTPPYIPPLTTDPGFAAALSGMLEQELPLPQSEAAIDLTNFTRWDLKALVQGEFLAYTGSNTVPPCTENVQWLVSRAPATASAEQISRLRTALAKLGPEGNWRVLMPFNHRPVEVMRSVRRVSPVQPITTPVVDDREFIAKRNAEDAVTIAQSARQYARDVDQTLRTSTIAHLKGFLAPSPTPVPTPAPTMLPANVSSKLWLDPAEQRRAMGSVAMQAVREAARRMASEAAVGVLEAQNLSAYAGTHPIVDRVLEG